MSGHGKKVYKEFVPSMEVRKSTKGERGGYDHLLKASGSKVVRSQNVEKFDTTIAETGLRRHVNKAMFALDDKNTLVESNQAQREFKTPKKPKLAEGKIGNIQVDANTSAAFNGWDTIYQEKSIIQTSDLSVNVTPEVKKYDYIFVVKENQRLVKENQRLVKEKKELKKENYTMKHAMDKVFENNSSTRRILYKATSVSIMDDGNKFVDGRINTSEVISNSTLIE